MGICSRSSERSCPWPSLDMRSPSEFLVECRRWSRMSAVSRTSLRWSCSRCQAWQSQRNTPTLENANRKWWDSLASMAQFRWGRNLREERIENQIINSIIRNWQVWPASPIASLFPSPPASEWITSEKFPCQRHKVTKAAKKKKHRRGKLTHKLRIASAKSLETFACKLERERSQLCISRAKLCGAQKKFTLTFTKAWLVGFTSDKGRKKRENFRS